MQVTNNKVFLKLSSNFTTIDSGLGTNDINEVDERGLTPLMWSSAYGQVPTAALLLKAGAMHSIKGPDGETAIHLAAAGGHTDIIRLLIAAGASVNESDDVRHTKLKNLTLTMNVYF